MYCRDCEKALLKYLSFARIAVLSLCLLGNKEEALQLGVKDLFCLR